MPGNPIRNTPTNHNNHHSTDQGTGNRSQHNDPMARMNQEIMGLKAENEVEKDARVVFCVPV